MALVGRARNQRSNAVAFSRSKLFFAVVAFLSIWVIFGGNMPTSVPLFVMLALSGSALLAFAVMSGSLASWGALSPAAQLMLAFCCLMPLLQLLPLPPAIWHSLPGRHLSVATLDAVGVGNQWHPITLSFEATLRTALITIWLFTFLLMLLQLSAREFRQLFWVLFALGLLNVAIGVVQVASGYTLLQFYKGLNSPFLSGVFSNKNHAGLFIAMTFLTGYAAFYGERGWQRSGITLVVPTVLVLIVALLATYSRAGLAFGFLALGFLAVISVGHRLRNNRRYGALLGIGIIVVLTIVASTDLANRVLVRFGGVDVDLRWSIWRWSWPMVADYFPVGGGIGSFPDLFPAVERLPWVKPTYVNHVHNDYIEQLIETGVAAPISWFLIVIALIRPLRFAWVDRNRSSGRLALIGTAMLFLIAVHSLIDYPLRRPAIAVTSMVALAALLRISAQKSAASRDGVRRSGSTKRGSTRGS